MVRIFIATENNNFIRQISKICTENAYHYNYSAELKIIEEMIMAETPDIIIIDEVSASFDPKSLIKIVKQINESTIIILLSSKDEIDKELLKTINAIIPINATENFIKSTLCIDRYNCVDSF